MKKTLREQCPILKFEDKGDERGKLVALEGSQTVPFEIRRVFYIYDTVPGVERGQHANRNAAFVLINVSGQSKVRITDGTEEIVVALDQPMIGVYIPPMLWKVMYDFSPNSLMLILSDSHYDEKDYIRDYEEYKALRDAEENR